MYELKYTQFPQAEEEKCNEKYKNVIGKVFKGNQSKEEKLTQRGGEQNKKIIIQSQDCFVCVCVRVAKVIKI